MDNYSYLSNADVDALDELYKNYRKDPDSVEFGWKKFFEGFDFAQMNFEDGEEQFLRMSKRNSK